MAWQSQLCAYSTDSAFAELKAEHELRQVVRKDLEWFCPAPTPAQVKGGLEVSVTPYRAGNFVVHPLNGHAEWAEWDARFGEIDNSWDWGVFIELEGEAGIGASATAEAELGTLDDGKTGFRAKAKAALGPSA